MRKRRTRRRTKKKTSRLSNRVSINGFPNRYAAKLKYTAFVTLDMSSITSGVGVQHRFRANSLFDPDFDGLGRQPRGFDQLASIYDHYTVIGSKLVVSFNQDTDTIQNTGVYCFCNLQDTAQALPSLVDMAEARKSNLKYMPRWTQGSKPATLVETYSPHRMFGIPKKDSIISNSRLTAQVLSNPLEDAIYAVGCVCQRSTTTDPSPIVARVDISFMCIFTELRPITQS